MPPGGTLDDVDLLLIDGDNLLHHVRGSRDAGGVAWLLPRLSEWRPDSVDVIVALDGHPASGEPTRSRVSRGVEFRHSGSITADELLIALLSSKPYAARARSIIVSQDRRLRDGARKAGARTRSVDWLVDLLAGAAGEPTATAPGTRPVGIGQGKAPKRRAAEMPVEDDADRDRWQPGRGATRKRGNPRRRAKHRRRR